MDEGVPQPCALPQGQKGAQQQIWIGTLPEAKREGGICSNSIGMERVGFHPSRQRVFQGTAPRHEGSHSRTTLRVGVAIHLDL